MIEVGTVVQKNGEDIMVLIGRGNDCDCGGACGVQSGKGIMVQVKNPLGAKIGDRIKLEIKNTSAVTANLLVYIFPLIGMVLGYVIGNNIGVSMGLGGEWPGILGAFALMALTFGGAFLLDRITKSKRRVSIKMLSFEN